MEIGICSGFIKEKNDLKAVETLLKWGFKNIDYAFEHHLDQYDDAHWQEHALALKALVDRYGARIHQVHGPWVRYLDEETNEEEKKAWIKRGIEVCGVLECPIYVMHPVKFKIPELYTLEEALDYNEALFKELTPLAKQHHVKIALENLYRYQSKTRAALGTGCNTAQELLALHGRLDPEVFGICLDTGHAWINQQDPAAMIEAYGERLIALHLHDNDQYTDAHLPMTYGKINWEKAMEALRKISYSGVFSMEIVARDEKFAQIEAAMIVSLAEKMMDYSTY